MRKNVVSKNVVTYTVTLMMMVALDVLWLGFVAKSWYQQGIGHLMAEDPKIAIAVLFYAVYALGLLVFVVLPVSNNPAQTILKSSLVRGGLYGFFAYATYDLTNWATLKDWPWYVALGDMGWGVLVSAVSAVAGSWTRNKY